MIFASDNWAGASEPIMAALARRSGEVVPAYGGDPLTEAVRARFRALFERDVAVFFVGTGTAANALGLANFCRPGAIIFAHTHAHIMVDEANAVEFLGGGAKVVGLEGEGGKITADALATAIRRYPKEFVHHGQPVAVSLSQITEFGQAYRPEEVAAISAVAKEHGLVVHMDGTRFGGAAAGLGLPPADITWKAGVDVLSFGGTKNGCIAAEAVVFFNPDDSRDFGFARQRIGHGFSKSWFIAAQFDAYLADDHWLDLARRTNAKAARLADAIRASENARLAIEPDANEVLAVLTRDLDDRLKSAGAVYYPWPEAGIPVAGRPTANEVLVRLVTSFQTPDAEIDRFAAVVAA